MKYNITIPDWFFDIKYNYDIIPADIEYNLLETGSNCQVFAYELLRLNGKIVPNFRSSEMWDDDEYSKPIENDDFQPLDLLFFNKTSEPYGAHVGVYFGDDKVIHNSQQIGNVGIWNLKEFLDYEKYKILIGGKRFIQDK